MADHARRTGYGVVGPASLIGQARRLARAKRLEGASPGRSLPGKLASARSLTRQGGETFGSRRSTATTVAECWNQCWIWRIDYFGSRFARTTCARHRGPAAGKEPELSAASFVKQIRFVGLPTDGGWRRA